MLQPDLAKWGGLSGCWRVARKIRGAGLRYCPHFLGGGIGLIASAHLLAAAGGDGLLEVDVNPNPLRDAFAPWAEGDNRGAMSIGQSQGGLPPDALVEVEADILRDCIRVVDTFHDPAPEAMVRVALAPCSPFSVSRELMRDAAILAQSGHDADLDSLAHHASQTTMDDLA